MPRTIDFYFDFPSPYAYLAHAQLPKIAAMWGKPEDLSQRTVLQAVLSRAGFDAERLLERASAKAITAQLDAATSAAVERGVFGAPAMFIGEQMFFGSDRLDFVVEALRAAA